MGRAVPSRKRWWSSGYNRGTSLLRDAAFVLTVYQMFSDFVAECRAHKIQFQETAFSHDIKPARLGTMVEPQRVAVAA